LKKLESCGLAAIQDPKGISGYVQACSSDIKKNDAISKLETVVARAEKAWYEESCGNFKEAFYWWSLVFADNFPSYYTY
jgi:hypothetical protein